MPFNAPASVPQITYASYAPPPNPYYPLAHSTFSTVPHPPPTQRDVYTNRKLNQDFVSIKAALLTMLGTRQVTNLPFGFPFRCVPVAAGRADGVNGRAHSHLSYSSYEFLEYVIVDPMSPPCCAIFSYTAPAYCCDPAVKIGVSSKMTWRIKIPSLGTSNEARTYFTISQVELDPALMETPFGLEFMTDRHMLLEALSISLEQGLHLTVQLALSTPHGPAVTSTKKCRDVYTSSNRDTRSTYRSGDLVFVAKKNDGQREVVHVYDPYGIFVRKS